MTREQAKINLESLGFTEVTDEQVTNYLNQVNGETKSAKDLADKYKGYASQVKDLENQLEELNNKNLSEVELAKKETEKSNATVADLQKQIALMQRKNELANLGIIGEDADKLFGEDGSLDFSVLGSIISARETSAKSAKEKELLQNTPNPSGSNTGNGEKTDIDMLAEKAGKDIALMNQTTTDVLSKYI